jgi:CRP/FNR family transcriptional regulator, anaerobic regulatory protein
MQGGRIQSIVRIPDVGRGQGFQGRDITLYEVGPGETCIINALCILSKMCAPANGITQTACDAILLPAALFRNLAEKHGALREYVFGVLASKFVNIIALVEEVAFEHIDERLMEYLVEKSEDGVLRVTHRKIASDLGTSREVVSRLLKDFERKGRLGLSRTLIRLNEPQ